ncbi:MAG: aminotransferase class I/II-fold pyridoxal phosphate-dependent enzyme [Nitrososphaera sp.]
MANQEKEDELEQLRLEMKRVTEEILHKVSRRMKIAAEIGAVKAKRGLEIKDEKAEGEMRQVVNKVADEIGLERTFASRLLNILLTESEAVQFSNRAQRNAPKQTHLGVFARAKALEADGRKIIHLEVGEPDFAAPASVGVALGDSFNSRQYHYTDVQGIPKLRRALADKIKRQEDQLIITPGGRFAVFAAIAGLLREGDELIITEPAWPAYRECAEFVGATVRSVRSSLEDCWAPDPEKIVQLVNPATRMIVLNYPNNPTGKVLDSGLMDRLVSLARKHGLYLLSDEVYSEYSFRPFVSALDYDYDRIIAVSSFSKTYAMTGFRIGYACSSRDVIAAMKKVQAIGITSVAEPIQIAAAAALKEDVSQNAKIMKQRLDYVCERLEGMRLKFAKPEGGMYVYAKLPAGLRDADFVEMLLENGVAVAPGSGFGDAYGNFIRISACAPIDALKGGMDKLNDVLETAHN